jgi:hypothetical protein
MATDRQIAPNRSDATNSTGPRTPVGTRRSRANAMQNGHTAETKLRQDATSPFCSLPPTQDAYHWDYFSFFLLGSALRMFCHGSLFFFFWSGIFWVAALYS